MTRGAFTAEPAAGPLLVHVTNSRHGAPDSSFLNFFSFVGGCQGLADGVIPALKRSLYGFTCMQLTASTARLRSGRRDVYAVAYNSCSWDSWNIILCSAPQFLLAHFLPMWRQSHASAG